MITPRVKLETQSFTYVSRNTGKEELVNLNENQLNAHSESFMLSDLWTIWKHQT